MTDYVKPKKHLGQHFLRDKSIAKSIVDALNPSTQNLIEIGAGTGILTQFIIEKDISNFKIIEIDTESVNYLLKHFENMNQHIIEADFLRFDLETIFPDHFSIVGNFPYNISNQILFKAFDYRNQITEIVGMFQKEVAERIASKPGNKKYGILSVLLQAFYDIDYLFTVNEDVFDPPPKVKSGVIKLVRNKVIQLDCNESLFKTVVKTAFNQRRKTVGNALKSMGAKDWPEEHKHLLNKRAEQLAVEDFVLLTNLAAETIQQD
ncbi:MAG: 16S rRNA (adenine(1518)-N(6)/adenine(1519)-N(6))-dimethyltransferase RsmA [Bacteroidales bacterium]|nr:16S rRNA (adenine(1518)-N(6)/adenine(1519)-N(6))-dimethyltransferase RsmA [Bacteroidales bacterium]